MKHFLFASLIVIVLITIGTESFSADLWFEDSNLGTPGGMPSDFFSKFDNLSSFSEAAEQIDVYMIRSAYIDSMDDNFIKEKLLPFLDKNSIKLALNVGGANWLQTGKNRKNVFNKELQQIRRLKSLGVSVSFISLQSVLSKDQKMAGEKLHYSLEDRLEDIREYITTVRVIAPEAVFGIIDALPSQGKEYKEPYKVLTDYSVKHDLNLRYIHLDMPFDLIVRGKRSSSWDTLRDVEQFVEGKLGLRFGLIVTSKKGGNNSSSLFHDLVTTEVKCYSYVGGTPDDYIVASWFPYPNRTIPDKIIGNEYPAMYTVLSIANLINRNTSGTGTQMNFFKPDSRSLQLCNLN